MTSIKGNAKGMRRNRKLLLSPLLIGAVVGVHFLARRRSEEDQHRSSSSLSTIDQATDLSEQPVRPSFIIHVGPSKTATTTLQHDCRDMADVLRLDNYVYLGKGRNVKRGRRPRRHSVLDKTLMDRRCLQALAEESQKQLKDYSSVPCWKPFMEEVENYYRSGHSIILSSEHYSSTESPFYDEHGKYFDALAEALHQLLQDRDKWNVLVVVGYRRYMEWVASALKQLHSAALAPRRTWGRHNRLPPTWQTITEWMHRSPPSAKNYHFTDTILPFWSERGFQTTILNFHGDDKRRHISTRFFCDIVPNAPHACQYTLQRPVSRHSRARSSALSSYHNLVIDAAERGLIDKRSHERHQMVQAVAHYCEDTLGLQHKDLPLHCPAEKELTELLEISLKLEKELMPELYQADEQTHRAAFWEMVNDKKAFCTIDTDRLFANSTTWDEVLQALKKNDWSTNG